MHPPDLEAGTGWRPSVEEAADDDALVVLGLRMPLVGGCPSMKLRGSNGKRKPGYGLCLILSSSFSEGLSSPPLQKAGRP